MEVAVGQKVWYVPDTCHRHDRDHRGERVFAYEFVGESHNQHMPYTTGTRVDFNHPALGAGLLYGTDTPGVLRTGAGHHIRATHHLAAWPAKITEVFPDGRVALDVAHPLGGSLEFGHAILEKGCFVTLHYGPDSGRPGHKLRYSKTFEPHTWHLLEDAEEK